MSGTRCVIIITGNRLQALMRSVIAMSGGDHPEAEQAIGNAQSLCQLGTADYDGVEVMTDEQQGTAGDVMQALVDVAQPIVNAGGGQHWKHTIAAALGVYLPASDALLAEVLAS